jgi:hypothetical protein
MGGEQAMNWKQHMLLGMVFFIIIYVILLLVDDNFEYGLYRNAVLPVPMLLLAIPIALYASMVDMKTTVLYVSGIVLIIFGVWVLVFTNTINAMLGLMGLTLSLLAIMLPQREGVGYAFIFSLLFSFGMGLILFDLRLGILTFGACLSHLVGDI